VLLDLHGTQSPTFDDFKKLFCEWPGESDIGRAEFQQCRRRLVKAVAGVHFNTGRTITTSGHSTGASKSYRWGPNFQSAFDFTEWTRFDRFRWDRKATVRILPGSVPVFTGVVQGLHIFNVRSGDVGNTASQMFSHFPSGKTCWFLLPAYAQALISHAPHVFDNLDPSKHVFEATGEPSSRKLRKFFKDRGLLYLDQLRSWMGGVTFITCPHGNQHFLDFMSEIKTEPDEAFQEIVTTDLWNLSQPFINFPTGDIVDWTRRETCGCGYPIDDFEFQPRNPVMIVRGLPLRFVDLAASLGNQCQKLLGLQKICVSFCLDGDTMFVDLVVNGTLDGVDVSPLEREFGGYLGMKCVVQERLSASIYKVKAVRQPDPK
jgi:hypothetical protein